MSCVSTSSSLLHIEGFSGAGKKLRSLTETRTFSNFIKSKLAVSSIRAWAAPERDWKCFDSVARSSCRQEETFAEFSGSKLNSLKINTDARGRRPRGRAVVIQFDVHVPPAPAGMDVNANLITGRWRLDISANVLSILMLPPVISHSTLIDIDNVQGRSRFKAVTTAPTTAVDDGSGLNCTAHVLPSTFGEWVSLNDESSVNERRAPAARPGAYEFLEWAF
ncbi:hypothetical protein EVAR_48498_1 [Eumeta japonica]|uniref:Uncharacterized protein n=1 Tax=Eumeta variegata TaxID=151549 RepID=A0A4C1XJE8_EUMVA|nr:hypothetical protein EVAR_48498_1 [Eumeta japonica]